MGGDRRGALYLLWMVYSFVLTNTAWQIPVGNEPKSPGEVNESVDKIALQIKEKIDHGPKVNISVPNFQTAVDLSPRKMPEYALAWANSPTQDVTLQTVADPTKVVADPSKTQPNNPSTPKIVELPKAPAATDLATAMGRSNVVVPPPVQIVATGDGSAPQPAPAPAQPANSGSDLDWITVSYKISISDLAKEFQRTMMPSQQQGTTCVLDVDLVRQELQPDGSWGPSTVCPKLTTSTQPPFPSEKARLQDLQTYLNWAVGATVEVLQPKFYDVMKGDVWALSKDLVGNGVVGDNGAPLILGPNDTRPGFDPQQFATTDPKQLAAQEAAMTPPLTNKEKQLISKARADELAKRAASNSKSRAPSGPPRGGGAGPGFGGGGRGGPGGGGAYAPEDGVRPAGRPPGPPPMRAGAAAGDVGGEGYVPPGAMAPQPQQQQSNYSQMFPLPTGEFDPRVLLTTNAANPNGPAAANVGTLVGWAHDWKTEPGKTYRYMIRYKIKNPVWATNGFTNPKTLADTFAITSVDSAWTGPIQAPPIVQFYFASAGGFGRISAIVHVYKYENGTTTKETFTVYPGDSIGTEKNGVDYSTGFTLVDLRPDLSKPDRTTAWLITPETLLVKRDVKADSESPQKQTLDRQIQAAMPPAAASAVGPGGAPAMINPTR